MTSIAGKRYSRRISLTERLLLAQPDKAAMEVQLIFEGTGALDPRALGDAVTAAAEACPGSRLVRRGSRWRDSGFGPSVRVLDGDRLDRETFQGLPELLRPLRCDRAQPTSEVVLLPGAQPAIVFRVHNAVMDSTGALLWAREVFRALRGEQPRALDTAMTETQLRRRVKQRGRHPIPRPTSPSPLRREHNTSGRGHFYLRRTIAGNHPAIVAKVAVALNELCDLGTGVFMIPTDLRRHLPGIQCTAPLVTSLHLPVRHGVGWPLVHKRLSTWLTEKQDLTVFPGPACSQVLQAVPVCVWRAISRMRGAADAGGPAPAFTLSHLERVNLSDYRAGGFQTNTVYAPPTWGMSPPTVSIVDVDGHTEVIIAGATGPGRREQAWYLLDGIEEMLSRSMSVLSGQVTPGDHDTVTESVS